MFIKKQDLPLVLTYNQEKQIFEYKKIINVFNRGKREVISLEFGNRVIRCTEDHKFLTENGWIEAKELTTFNPIIGNSQECLQTLNVLNDDQMQIVLGSYLGDGSIQVVGNNRFKLRIIHGIKQKDYCEWKAKQFNCQTQYIEKNGFSKKPAIRFATKCFALPFNIPSGQKNTCPQWVLDKLDERGIAIWCMDDGSKNNGMFRLHTNSFDLESHHLFIKKFKNYNIDCYIKEDIGPDYKYYYLTFDTKNTKKLIDLIQKYIHPNMTYKIDNFKKQSYIWNNQYKNYKHIILDKINDKKIFKPVFDLEIEDNHNFLITSKTDKISGVVVHNCQNMISSEIVTLLTRVGRYSKLIICGDSNQSDLNGKSGFKKIYSVFDDDKSKENGIYVFKFTNDDIVRSEVVRFILEQLEEKLIKKTD